MELEEGGNVITKVIGVHHLETMNVRTMSGICTIMFQSINEMLRHFPERVNILKLQMVLDVTPLETLSILYQILCQSLFRSLSVEQRCGMTDCHPKCHPASLAKNTQQLVMKYSKCLAQRQFSDRDYIVSPNDNVTPRQLLLFLLFTFGPNISCH